MTGLLLEWIVWIFIGLCFLYCFLSLFVPGWADEEETKNKNVLMGRMAALDVKQEMLKKEDCDD